MVESQLLQKFTPDRKHLVNYLYIKSSLAAQRDYFNYLKIDFISPSQKALMSFDSSTTNLFLKYSRTNMGILFMFQEKEKQIALIKNGFSDDTTINDLLLAHTTNIDTPIDRDLAHSILEIAEKNDLALILPRGSQTISTKEFDKPLPYFMFNDESINLNSKDYGYILQSKYGVSNIVFDFEDSSLPPLEHGTYCDKIRMRGPGGNFKIYGRGKPLSGTGGAMGVRFNLV
ncbi:MAG: hypothetical protein WC758_02530 [Candidatus Woesearchaeota archaeon]|jgi:hypothetical protein